MGLWQWFRSFIASLGLYKLEANILFVGMSLALAFDAIMPSFWPLMFAFLVVGLDNAGKSTLLARIRDDSVSMFTPTLRPVVKEFVCQHFAFVV